MLRKFSVGFGAYGFMLHLIPLRIRLNLVKSLLIPLFTYCDVVFGAGLDAVSKRLLIRAFNACVRYVFRLRRFASVGEFSSRILGCSILSYLDLRMCTFLHSLLRRREPSYLFTCITAGRSARAEHLIVPRHCTSFLAGSLFVGGIILWNALPVALRRIVSTSSFRRECLSHVCG